MTSPREPPRARPAFKPRAHSGLRKTLLLLHFVWLGSAAIAAFSSPVQAQSAPASGASQLSEEEREREAESIARSIMSPFCPGRTVSSCPNAGPWRDDIRKWVGEGVDPEEIKTRLEARFPEHNLMGVPPNRLGWLLPVGSAILALSALVLAMRYLVKPGQSVKQDNAAPAANAEETATSQAKNQDWDARLDEELETLDER